MSGTYKAVGINLKATPLGESDRVLTILTEEYGLLRAVAPGSRKQNSSLAGRSNLFVVNQLLIAKGRNLDKIIQAESLASYPGLSQDLRKLTASQYLAELTLYQALSDQPQTELFGLLREALDRLEKQPGATALAHLTQATFALMDIAGLAPQVNHCCISQQPIAPDFSDPDWRVGFNTVAGGVFSLSTPSINESHGSSDGSPESSESVPLAGSTELNAIELSLLQQFARCDPHSTPSTDASSLPSVHHPVWLSIERLLRHYAQYHFDRPIRSAALIETCFSADIPSLLQTS